MANERPRGGGGGVQAVTAEVIKEMRKLWRTDPHAARVASWMIHMMIVRARARRTIA